MKSKAYEYILIVEREDVDPKKKTQEFSVRNKKSFDILGHIKWYSSWRQYCFIPCGDTVFSGGCLSDIINFLSLLKEERKQGKNSNLWDD